MDIRSAIQPRQMGYMLFEAMVSLLVFSIGVLGILGMVLVAVQNNTDAKYRIDASLLANELIGQMWADNRDPATLKANFEGGGGTDGPKYTVWLNDIITNHRLPGVEANSPNLPIVGISTVNNTSQVDVTMSWHLPGESAPHSYRAVTQISKSNDSH